MKKLGATLITILIAVALVGCGGSSAQSAKTCWTKQTRVELTQHAGADGIDKANRGLIITSVNAYTAGVALPSWLPSYIKPWLHQTQQKCGTIS